MNVAIIAELLRERAQLRTDNGIPVTVDLVESIARTTLGKAALIRRARLATAGR